MSCRRRRIHLPVNAMAKLVATDLATDGGHLQLTFVKSVGSGPNLQVKHT